MDETDLSPIYRKSVSISTVLKENIDTSEISTLDDQTEVRLHSLTHDRKTPFYYIIEQNPNVLISLSVPGVKYALFQPDRFLTISKNKAQTSCAICDDVHETGRAIPVVLPENHNNLFDLIWVGDKCLSILDPQLSKIITENTDQIVSQLI